MRKAIFVAELIALAILPGCKVSDIIFAALSDSYSGGGYTQADKQSHYERQIDPSPHYSPWNE